MVNPPNYCAACKFQFKTKDEMLLHIQTSHRNANQFKQADLGQPQKVEVMHPDDLLAFYLERSLHMRNVYGVSKVDGKYEITDHDVFMKLDSHLKSQLKGALGIIRRRTC